jgi:sugar/nucleoside kinase (ribokinase family)
MGKAIKAELSLDSLGKIGDSQLGRVFRDALRKAGLDCAKRPTVKELRKVILTVSYKPITSDEGVCKAAQIAFDIKESFPKKAISLPLELSGTGAAIIVSESEEDVTVV